MIQVRNNQLSALIIIVTIKLGIYAAGLTGAFLSIPAAACLRNFILPAIKRNQNKTNKLLLNF